MKYYIYLLFPLCLTMIADNAQAFRSDTTIFTLEECIDFALKNNLQLRHREIEMHNQRIELNQAKSNLLPSVNGNTEYYFNQGRSIDPVTNEFTDAPVNYQQYGLNINMTLFDGLINFKTIKNRKEALKASVYGLSAYQRKIVMDVVKSYMEVLLMVELLNDAQQRSKSTLEELNRTEKLVNLGEIASTELSQLKAQHADNRLTVINRKNELKLGYLQLQQILNISMDQPFRIVSPKMEQQNIVVSRISFKDLFHQAQQLEPSIKESLLRQEIAKRDISIAKGNYYPNLQLFAGTYSSHSSNPSSFLNESSYIDQLDFNLKKFVGLELSIPISNNGKIKYQVQKSKIQQDLAASNLSQAKQTLWKSLETIYVNALAAEEEYQAAIERTTIVEEAYSNTQRQFELGVIDAISFNQSQSQVEKAISYQIQRKYEVVFYQKMLNFYQGNSLSL